MANNYPVNYIEEEFKRENDSKIKTPHTQSLHQFHTEIFIREIRTYR